MFFAALFDDVLLDRAAAPEPVGGPHRGPEHPYATNVPVILVLSSVTCSRRVRGEKGDVHALRRWFPSLLMA
jgi:hypothetical protein